MEVAGRFFDGRTALSQIVRAQLGDDGIVVLLPDGGVLRWNMSALRLAEKLRDGAPLRLTEGDGSALLVLEDAAARTWLAAHRLRRERPAARARRRMAWVALVAAGLLGGFAVSWFTFAPSLLAALIPQSVETAIGDRMVEQVAGALGLMERRTVAPCTGPAGQRAIENLAGQLASAAGFDEELRVVVVDSRVVNAMAAPGGRIVVMRGLIDNAAVSDELAGVLAHEIGHVQSHDAIRAAIRSSGLALLISLGSGGASGGGAMSPLAQLLLTAAYSREAEEAADGLAAQMLERTEIGTRGLARFFTRLAQKQGAAEAAFAIVSTHPLSAERAARLREGPPARRLALSDEEWQAVKTMCGGERAENTSVPRP